MATGKPIKSGKSLLNRRIFLVKTPVTGQTGPVNRSNRSVYRSEPVTCAFEFGFEFNRFPPVSGQTGPVNRYRRPAV